MHQKGLAIELLVNNAGFGSNGAFLDLPLEGEASMIEVNCTALLQLTHLFAGPMRISPRAAVRAIAAALNSAPES